MQNKTLPKKISITKRIPRAKTNLDSNHGGLEPFLEIEMDVDRCETQEDFFIKEATVFSNMLFSSCNRSVFIDNVSLSNQFSDKYKSLFIST